MRRKIIWSLWNDPFDKDPQKEFLNEEDGDKVLANIGKRWEGDGEDDEGYSKFDETKYRPCVFTNHGPMPIEMHTKFNSNFRIWLADATFRIPKSMKKVIKDVPGVDGIFFASPHSFRVQFGRAFDPKSVRAEITQVLDAGSPKCGLSNPFDLNLEEYDLDEIKESMEKTHWGFLIMPNGNTDDFETNSEEEYDDNIENYEVVQELTGAAIYSYTRNT